MVTFGARVFPGEQAAGFCRYLSGHRSCMRRAGVFSALLLLVAGLAAWAFAMDLFVTSALIAGGSSAWWLAAIPVGAASVSTYVSGLFMLRAIGGIRLSRPRRDAWVYSGFSVLGGLLSVLVAIAVWVLILFITPGVYIF
jgi:hypothetical protein